MRPKLPGQSVISGIGYCRLILTVCRYTALFFGILLVGCTALSSLAGTASGEFYKQQELSAPYDRITLQKSLTLDALPAM